MRAWQWAAALACPAVAAVLALTLHRRAQRSRAAASRLVELQKVQQQREAPLASPGANASAALQPGGANGTDSSAVARAVAPAAKVCTCAQMLLVKSSTFEYGPIPPADPGCRCRHEPELLAAGERLAAQGAALDRSRAQVSSPSQHHVHVSFLGGFNNQRQCLINAILLLAQLPRGTVLVLPPATPISYPGRERWPHDYVHPYVNRSARWLPWGMLAAQPGTARTGHFETLWDPDAWFRALNASGLSTAAAAPPGPVRKLPTVEEATGCGYFNKKPQCLQHNHSEWGPLRAAAKVWSARLAGEAPGVWYTDALCFQVGPMAGTDVGCPAVFGPALCAAAFDALRPNAVAVAAADIVRRRLAGVGRWDCAHFHEDWKCPLLLPNFISAMQAAGVGRGSLLFVTGFGHVPPDVAEWLNRTGVTTVSKEAALPNAAERVPYEIAGQVDWIVAASAPGVFFSMAYRTESSFDIYVRQERRRRGLRNSIVSVGEKQQPCGLTMSQGFAEAPAPPPHRRGKRRRR